MPSTTDAAEAAQKLLDAGLSASRNNDSTQALALFAQAGAAAPGWALPHFLAGSEYAALGQWDQAEAALANAVLLDATLQIARYQLGLLQFSSGRAAAALVTWQALLDTPADPGLADFVRGFASLAQDAFQDATTHFQRGLAQTGLNPAVAQDIRLVLGRIPGNTPDDGAKPAEPAGPPAHVLVANYGKFNLH